MTTATKKRTAKEQPAESETDAPDVTAATDDADPEKDAVENQLAELQRLRDMRNITLGWRKKFAQAQAKVSKAKAKFDEADAARKQAKAGVDRAVADELALVARFTYGEQLLPYDVDPDKADDSNPATTQQTLPGTDEGSLQPITVLLAKQLKKIVGADVFQESKDRGEPLGFTEKGLEIIQAQGWDTIGKLEKAMRDDQRWFDQLKGFGETKVNQLINTLMAFRKVHPHPEENSTAEDSPADTKKWDWEDAVADLDFIVRKSGELVSDGPSEAITFAMSVGVQAVEMRKWIEDHKSVTDDQLTAIKNWTEGLEKWNQPAS